MNRNEASCGRYIFRGLEYDISVRTIKNGTFLTIEVEDKVTGDQWKGSFDCTYIEDLTRKTGNFKQFSVFVSMLESALDKSTESVTLDLLTYGDLELLRNRKSASSGIRNEHRQRFAGSRQQENKRYLILVYSVEFDRIHYPLPLVYQGKPDPVQLQNLVHQLNDEITKLKTGKSVATQDDNFYRLKVDYEGLLQEKQSLEVAYEMLKKDMNGNNKSHVSKEVNILKKVVQNLELEMLKEKNKFQRQYSKKAVEVKRLTSELHELSARERTLQLRVKSLTNELAMYKRRAESNVVRSRTPIPRTSSAVPPPASARRSVDKPRSTSQGRRGGDVARSSSRGSCYERSTSRDSRPRSASRGRASSLNTEREARAARPRAERSRTPTPHRYKRFNPTQYNEEKKRKLRESQERAKRRTPNDGVRSSAERIGRSRYRSSGLSANDRSSGSYRSRNASAESRNSFDRASVASGRRRSSVRWEDSDASGADQRLSSTPNRDREMAQRARKQRATHDTDIDEIDARLDALQQYMCEMEKNR